MQNRTECTTTDRISQRAMPRGYVESLENKCSSLEARLKELEAIMAADRSSRGGPHGAAGFINGGPKHEDPNMRNGAGYMDWPPGLNGAKGAALMNGGSQQMNGNLRGHPHLRNPSTSGDFTKRRAFRAEASSGAYYVGLSSGVATLHSMKDSALSVLGIELDLSGVDPSDSTQTGTEGGLNDSYASSLSSLFNANLNVPQNLALPSRAECMDAAEWYFLYSHPYLPVLHRPTFMKKV